MSTIETVPRISAPHPGLAASRRFCERMTRQAAKNFYYGLRLLKEPKRSSMYALYTYMRVIDDIVDNAPVGTHEKARGELERWRELTREALASGAPPDDHPVWPAFIDMARRHGYYMSAFDDALDGQARDLSSEPFANFSALERYCYQVAGTVGVASVIIFGHQGGKPTLDLAVKRGIAFQLTNILRDVREDAGRGRLYLPADELGAAGLSRADLLDGAHEARAGEFIRVQAARAAKFYAESAPLEASIDEESRPTLRAMTRIYRSILTMIEEDPPRVLRERISLSLVAKLRIAWNAARGR